MRLLSTLARGAPTQEREERFDVALLQRFYGTDGDIQHPHQGATGAGSTQDDLLYPPILGQGLPPDLEDEEFADLSEPELATLTFIQEQLASQQQNHVRHPPIKVPRHQNPFSSLNQRSEFWQAVQEAEAEGYIPRGYGVHPDEWDDGVYPEIEVLKVGTRKCSEMQVGMPNSIWFPRAVYWTRALHIMTFCL
jgi:hypothetical protein